MRYHVRRKPSPAVAVELPFVPVEAASPMEAAETYRTHRTLDSHPYDVEVRDSTGQVHVYHTTLAFIAQRVA